MSQTTQRGSGGAHSGCRETWARFSEFPLGAQQDLQGQLLLQAL